MNRKLLFPLHHFLLNLFLEISIVLYASENIQSLEKLCNPSNLFALNSIFDSSKAERNRTTFINNISNSEDPETFNMKKLFPGRNTLIILANEC